MLFKAFVPMPYDTLQCPFQLFVNWIYCISITNKVPQQANFNQRPFYRLSLNNKNFSSNKFYRQINKMGQNICSNTSQINSQMKNSFFDFQYGQDQTQGQVEHIEDIKCKQNGNLQMVLSGCTQRLKESKLMYKDPTIPNDRLILKSISKQSNQNKQIQAVFLRPCNFLNGGQKGKLYRVFPNDESHSDYVIVNDQVMQYFGVFLCFLANNPLVIEQIILTQSNTYGIVAVKMSVCGKQVVVYIDDYILCKQKVPLFSQPIKNLYLWPNLLQKAWLKTNGFTQKIIQKSTPQQVFQSFLNYPYKKIILEGLQEAQIKDQIKKYLYQTKKEFGYTLTTKKDPKIHIGISGRKYLYLMGTFVLDNKRMFYIRNPCGKFDFRGNYDQVSGELKSKIKEVFNVVGWTKGNFVLDQNQFIEQISQFAICYYSAYLKTTTQSIQLENNSEIFIQTELKNPGNLSLCFRQQSKKKSQNRFSPITYHIFKMDKFQSDLVSGKQNLEGCFGLHNSYLLPNVIQYLPQSKYLIRIKKKDKKKHYFRIQSAIIACCAHEVKFDMKNQEQFSQLFKQYIKNQGKKKLKARSNGSSKKSVMNPIQHVPYMLGDLICIYIQYVSPKPQQFKIQISFPQLKNLQLIYPQINLSETSVLPKTLSLQNKQEILVFQKIDLTGETDLGYFQLEAF